jgi:hypothetical protein
MILQFCNIYTNTVQFQKFFFSNYYSIMERKYSKEQSSDEKDLYPPYPPYPPYHLMMQDYYYYNKYQPSPGLYRSQEQHQ